MEIADAVIIAGIVFTTIVTFLAFILLWRSPRTKTRDLALSLMGISTVESILYLIACTEIGDSARLALVIVVSILVYLAVTVTFQMVKSFSRWRHIGAEGIQRVFVYIPILVLTVIIGVAGAAMPSNFRLDLAGGLPAPDVGFLLPLFWVVGGGYLVAAIAISLVVLAGEDQTIRGDAMALLIVLVVQAGYYPILVGVNVQMSSLAVDNVIVSLFGLILANAAIKKSPLIIPRKEDIGEKAPEKKVRLLAPGASYLYLGAERETARKTFCGLVLAGKEGLWITRKRPNEARKRYGLVKTPFIWLTGAAVEGEVCISPGDTGKLSTALVGFIGAAKEFVILFEGIEYLHSNTGFQNTLRLCHFLNDKAMGHNGIIMLSVDPAAFSPTEMAMLASEAAEVFGERSGREAGSDAAGKAGPQGAGERPGE